MSKTIYKIIDSVDIFLTDNSYITVYYMNTRQRRTFKINKEFIHLLENIDGVHTLNDIKKIMSDEYNVSESDVEDAILLLKDYKIITDIVDYQKVLDDYDFKRYSRQINYFSELLGSELLGIKAQKRLMDSKVLIFGCGAIGGDIAMILVMAGVRQFYLYDDDIVEASDVARHMYYNSSHIGMKKTEALKGEIENVEPNAIVEIQNHYMSPKDDIEDMIKGQDFVIDTLDEPYIGYTAAKISRICIKNNIPHYIGGGFDAHLASTGELIIPYVTPCAECYANYFKVKLKDWKPKKHPVKQRFMEIGGLSSMSLFSSSFASIEIIKLLAGLTDMEKEYKTRGELLFDSYDFTYLQVERDENCPICGRRKS